MKRVLITGISGFAGSHLAEYLTAKTNYHIGGTYLSESSLQNIALIREKVTLWQLDLTNADQIANVVQEFKPDYIFHLAAISNSKESFDKPAETITNNIVSQINLLEAIRKSFLQTSRTLVISSADIYGKVAKDDLPIDEDTPLMPINPYGVSKIAQDFLGLQYALAYKLAVIRARPFNHIGPRQSQGFVIADFAKRIAEIEKGKRAPIMKVGNLKSRRDFTDVRDMVAAYHLLLEKGTDADAYNIGFGRSITIGDVLTKMINFAKTKQIQIETDESKLRIEDTPDRVCDNKKICGLGWRPTIPIEKSLQDTLDYWRNIV
ncbi:MAG: GDP-mannose 4,6-dehydratase [Candidatus Levybacteria bacterium]|nr:GDP-mannose 4,6-dehydratase [Candidatus Levybacteria bacterium]